MTEPAVLQACEFTPEVIGGVIAPAVRQQIAETIRKADGKRIRITLAPYTKTRSLNQNSFFHGPFLDALTEMYRKAGNEHSRDEIKEQMKELFGLRKTVTGLGGITTTTLLSTKKYTTVEIEEFMEKIRAWAAPYQHQLPYPNEADHG